MLAHFMQMFTKQWEKTHLRINKNHTFQSNLLTILTLGHDTEREERYYLIYLCWIKFNKVTNVATDIE